MVAIFIASGLRFTSSEQPLRLQAASQPRSPQPTASMEQGPSRTSEEREQAELRLASWMEVATKTPMPLDGFALHATESKGIGLFASQNIERGTYLFDYEGEVLRDSEYDGMSDYAISVENADGVEYVVDAADPAAGGIARYLNHAPSGGPACNVAFLRGSYATWPGPEPPALHAFSSKDIRAGDELCFDYGDEYWAGASPGAVAWRREMARQQLGESAGDGPTC